MHTTDGSQILCGYLWSSVQALSGDCGLVYHVLRTTEDSGTRFSTYGT